MVDVGRNDRTPARDFRAYELRRHKLRDRCSVRLSLVLMQQRVAWRVAGFPGGFASEVLANRDELHLGSDDAATSIMKLGDTCARLRAQHPTATQRRKVFQPA